MEDGVGLDTITGMIKKKIIDTARQLTCQNKSNNIINILGLFAISQIHISHLLKNYDQTTFLYDQPLIQRNQKPVEYLRTFVHDDLFCQFFDQRKNL